MFHKTAPKEVDMADVYTKGWRSSQDELDRDGRIIPDKEVTLRDY